jgi:hypothetical protein
MRICLALLLLLSCGFAQYAYTFPSNTVEINLVDRTIQLTDFYLGELNVSGIIVFAFEEGPGFLACDLEARDLAIGAEKIAWAKARLIMQGDILVVDYLSMPECTFHGRLDLTTGDIAFDIDGSWEGTSEIIEGKIYVKAKVWGTVGNILASGYLTVEDGIYEGEEFEKLRLDFVGKPPVLNITDSEVLLPDGTTLEIEGVLDLGRFGDFIPGAQFKPQKVFIGDWQLFSEDDREVGLRKSIDEKFDVFLNTAQQEGEDPASSATELRYNWKDDKFLRLRVEEDRSILQLEQRRDF